MPKSDTLELLKVKFQQWGIWVALLGVVLGGTGVCGVIKDTQSYAKKEEVVKMIQDNAPSKECTARIEAKVDALREDMRWVKDYIRQNK